MLKLNQLSITLAIALFWSCMSIQAQGVITGTVIDADSGEPIIGAYVTNGVCDFCSTEIVVTNFDGQYTITLPKGTHNMSCSFIGMATAKNTVTLNDGDKVVWDISLEAEAKVLDMAVVSAGRFEQSVAEVTAIKEIITATTPIAGNDLPMSKPITKAAPTNPKKTPSHLFHVIFSFKIGPAKAFVNTG